MRLFCAKKVQLQLSVAGSRSRFVEARLSKACSAQRELSRTDDLPNRKGYNVKLIIAAIKPFKLEEVREALTSIGVRGMMVTEIKGFGSQSGHTEIYRGAEYAVNFVPKVKLEIVVSDGMADQVGETIQTTAKTDKIGDGKIFVLDVQQAVRVRTGETNDDAL
jgi:nitrogen regulatory protein P-II 1